MTQKSHADPWEKIRRLPMGTWVEVRDHRGNAWAGTVVPRHEFSGDRILLLKVESGYNVGVRIEPGSTFLSRPVDPKAPAEAPGPPARAPASSAECVVLLTTGGTIASRVDYETGGVRPVGEPSEILDFYPDLQQEGPVRVVPVFDRLSENVAPEDWVVLAEEVVRSFQAGARGVVIAHGTDTMGFTAAALSFLLRDLPGPVVLVGAQRSPDRPSSDGRSNLRAAAQVARDRRIGEVLVVMHEGLSDGRFAIHRGTRVRKMHSSRRDAFRSRNAPPLGVLDGKSVTWSSSIRAPSPGPARLDGPIDPRAGLLWFYPGLTPERAQAFTRGLRGVVLAGTGLGHVSSAHLPWIRHASSSGVVVAMTSQCLEGTTDPYVYSTGRELLRSGVEYLGDMLPETAYVKLLWALGHSAEPGEVARLLRTELAGEISDRRTSDGGA